MSNPVLNNPWLQGLNQLGDGLLVCNRQGTIVWANPGLQDKLPLLGGEQLNLSPQDPANLRSTRPLHQLEAAVAECLNQNLSVDREIKVGVGQGQKRYFELLAYPCDLQDNQNGCAVVLRDMTLQVATEKMRRDFVANVSHELRTPLSVLKGYAETLLSGAIEEPVMAREFVEVIDRHANRLYRLVEDLLDLSRLEDPEFELQLVAVDLPEMVERVLLMARDSAQAKHLHLKTLLPSDLPPVLGHAGTLEQVLINLVDNAIKYTADSGEVSVKAVANGGQVCVCVEDTGIGIPAKALPRLFERFYRVDKARSRDMGGTGLGLSIVKHIVQAHGGRIWVESEQQQGSRFFFTLRTKR